MGEQRKKILALVCLPMCESKDNHYVSNSINRDENGKTLPNNLRLEDYNSIQSREMKQSRF